MNIIKLFLFILILFQVLTTCTKRNLRINACTGKPIILTEHTKSDSVYFLAPNIFTAVVTGNVKQTFKVWVNHGNLKKLSIFKGRKELFTTTDVNIGWNGTYKGKLCSTGNYKYEVELTTITGKEILIEGKFTMLSFDITQSRVFIENCEDCISDDMIHPYFGAVYSYSYPIGNIKCIE